MQPMNVQTTAVMSSSSQGPIDPLIAQMSTLSLSRLSSRLLDNETYQLWLTLLQNDKVHHMLPKSEVHCIDSAISSLEISDKAYILVKGELPFQIKLFHIQSKKITSQHHLVLDPGKIFNVYSRSSGTKSILISTIQDLFDALEPVFGKPLTRDPKCFGRYGQIVTRLHRIFANNLNFLERLYKYEVQLSDYIYDESLVKSDYEFLQELIKKQKHIASQNTISLSEQCYSIVKIGTQPSFFKAVVENVNFVVSIGDDPASAAIICIVDNACLRIRKMLCKGFDPQRIMCNTRLDICTAHLQGNFPWQKQHIGMLHKLYNAMRIEIMTPPSQQ